MKYIDFQTTYQQLSIFACLWGGGGIILISFFFRLNFNAKKAQQQIGTETIPFFCVMPISSKSDIEVKLKQLQSLISAYVFMLISATTTIAKIKHIIIKTLFKLHRGTGELSKNIYLFLKKYQYAL